MKKLVVLLLCTVCLCMTACGDTQETNDKNVEMSSVAENVETEVKEPESKAEDTAASSVAPAETAPIENFTVSYLEDGTVVLSDYSGKDETAIIVPAEVDGKPVTVLDYYTFANHEELVSVELPDSLIEIRTEAFINCSGLQHIKLGSSLQKIGDSALAYSHLQELEIPDTLVEVASCAFANNDMKSITIPRSWSEVGEHVFANTDITELFIPGNIKMINKTAFSGCNQLVEVTMEDGLEVICESAFDGCDMLEKVTLASTVQSIGSDAFAECPALTYIYIPESVTEIDPYIFYMTENVTIHTPAGSYAESFAIENEIPYVNE